MSGQMVIEIEQTLTGYLTVDLDDEFDADALTNPEAWAKRYVADGDLGDSIAWEYGSQNATTAWVKGTDCTLRDDYPSPGIRWCEQHVSTAHEPNDTRCRHVGQLEAASR
jgi:hypothetical protein